MIKTILYIVAAASCVAYVFSGIITSGGDMSGVMFASGDPSIVEKIIDNTSLDRIGVAGLLFWFLREVVRFMWQYGPQFVKAFIGMLERLKAVDREIIELRRELSTIIDGIGDKTVSIKPKTDVHTVKLEKDQ